MSQVKTQQVKIRSWSKPLIILSLLLFVATPFIFVYSQKLFYWIECGGKPNEKGVGWSRCGGLGIHYIYYAIALSLIVLLIGGLLMLYASRSRKTN